MDLSSLPMIIGIAVAGVFGLLFLKGILFTTQQQTKRIVERFGKFTKVVSPGICFKIPLIDRVSKPISLRVAQLDIQELSYTKSGTSVTISGAVQYQVDENDESVKQAYYKLADPEAQIRSHVSSSIRAKVPNMDLEAVQNNQAEIASHVKTELEQVMRGYGYIIADVLITKADPDPSVVDANNRKYASQQAKTTAENEAAANYTRVVQAAKAEAEAMKLHGEGIANERTAITKGLQESIEEFANAVPGTTAGDALRMVALQNYLDTVGKLAQNGSSKVIFMPTGVSGAHDLLEDLTRTLIASGEATKPAEEPAADAASSETA